MSPTAQGHRNAAGRLLLTTLFLLAFAGGARADEVEIGTDDGTTNSYSGNASYSFAVRTFNLAAGN